MLELLHEIICSKSINKLSYDLVHRGIYVQCTYK